MSGPLFSLGKTVVTAGVILIIFGLIMMFSGRFINLGRLPGDIFIQKGNFSFYFPVISSIILSILLTVILNIVFRR